MPRARTLYIIAGRVQQEGEGEWSEGRRLYQNGIMDEKTLPVVPSFWKEGLGVVEKNKVRPFS